MELLSLDIDHWTDQAGDPWGTYLPLVVRSWERLRSPDLQLGWQDSWDRLCVNFLQLLPKPLW